MIPIHIKEAIMQVICDQNHEIYLVGGYVRNKIANPQAKIYDLDFATSMPSQQLFETFIKMPHIQHYPEFGAVHFKYDVYDIEITQFRKEANYQAFRYPTITFTESRLEDSWRRDFTINALYLDSDEKLYDDHGGLCDLEKGILRVIGDSKQKMQEDHLRTIRALRLMATDGYHFDEKLEVSLITDLRLEKKQMASEVKKLLEGPYLMKVMLLYDDYLRAIFKTEVPKSVLHLSHQALYRLILIEKDLNEYRAWLEAFGLSQTLIKQMRDLHHLYYSESVDLQTLFLKNQALFHDYLLFLSKLQPQSPKVQKYLQQVKQRPKTLAELKINGHDLVEAHVPQVMRGYILKQLLWAVFWCDLANEPTSLLAYARRLEDELY